MTDYVSLAEKALLGGERSRWDACLISASMIGDYHVGFARELADRMGYSDISRVSDLADAGRARKALRMPAREVYRFRISVFTFCHRILQSGADPSEVRNVLYDCLTEWERPRMKDVTDALSSTFNIPPREPTAKSWLNVLDRLVSWGASKIDHQHRKEWDNATKTIREILHSYKQRD